MKMRLEHEFVTLIPAELKPRVVYVSIEYATVVHLCCCGCDSRVVTPLGPARWSLTFDGRSVSLHPSIGNWSMDCRSHYWIRKDEVLWDRAFSRAEIAEVRERDRRALEEQYGAREAEQEPAAAEQLRPWWRRAANWLGL